MEEYQTGKRIVRQHKEASDFQLEALIPIGMGGSVIIAVVTFPYPNLISAECNSCLIMMSSGLIIIGFLMLGANANRLKRAEVILENAKKLAVEKLPDDIEDE